MNALTLIILFVLLATSVEGQERRAIWSKAAIPLVTNCAEKLAPRFDSPDGRIRAELRCQPAKDDDPLLYLLVRFPDGQVQKITIEHEVTGPYGLTRRASEILWAPDSSAFLINGHENAYAGYFVDVYRIEGGRFVKYNLTRFAQRDMVRQYPPCKATPHDDEDCRDMIRNPDFNMSGLTWVDGSSAIIVFAEIPCSSSYGGFMCEVHGYKIDAHTGKILQRMKAPEMKAQWQKSMAWDMTIPEPTK